MKKITLFLLSLLLFTNIAFACINDYAAKQFELQPFPNEDQLIAASFHIHSKAFYEWRIKDRLNKIKQDPNNPALWDDLSVSYEKTGKTQLAIETLKSVLDKYPNRYETLANLGTFYIHHNEYEKGLVLLKKAIIINPQAHYGREIYQIKVVEYIISLNKPKPLKFPIQNKTNFADFILKNVSEDKQKDELIKAIVGVSGMLKFGNNDSPILLEVLGDLYSRFSKDYISNFHLYPQTQLSSIAKNFYIAAFIRSNLTDKNILINFFNERNELASSTYWSSYYDKMNFTLEQRINSINYDIKEANTKKLVSDQDEEKVIIKSKKPEEDIYSTFFKKPEEQPDLFKNKKETLNYLIDLSNMELILSLLKGIIYFVFTTILVSYALFVGFANLLFSKLKSDNPEFKIYPTNYFYLQLCNAVIIMIGVLLGNNLSATYFQYSLLYNIENILTLLTVILFLFSLISFTNIFNNIKEYATDNINKKITILGRIKKTLFIVIIASLVASPFFGFYYGNLNFDHRVFFMRVVEVMSYDNSEIKNPYKKVLNQWE